MKATEQHFHVPLFIVLHGPVLKYFKVLKSTCMQIKPLAIKQYFHVVLVIML